MSDRTWHNGPPPHVSFKELCETFSYDENTGELKWEVEKSFKIRKGHSASTDSGNGYKKVMLNGKNMYVHRIIWAMKYGEFPEQIDHINGIRSDNRLSNLRKADNLLNSHNHHKFRETNSGFRNVYFDKRYGTFRATIYSNGKRIYMGTFITAIDAHKAVLDARNKYQSIYYPKNARVPRVNP
jgi:hypothetical protein